MKKNQKNQKNFIVLSEYQNLDREEIIKKLEQDHKRNKHKFKMGLFWFFSINIVIFTISSLLIFLNIFAIRLNETSTKIFFITIAIISGVVSFLVGIGSFFEFQNIQLKYKNKINLIVSEYQKLQDELAIIEKDNATQRQLLIDNFLRAIQ